MTNRVTRNNINHILNNGAGVNVSMNKDSITVGCTTVTVDVIKLLLEKHAFHFPDEGKEVKIQSAGENLLPGEMVDVKMNPQMGVRR